LITTGCCGSYRRKITHVRTRPVRRAFCYRSYLWLVDLDDLPRVPLALRPFARFQARDHLGGSDGLLRAGVDAWLAGQGIDLAGGRVLMLGHARVLGYVFNPHYALTLAEWRRQFLAAADKVSALGFGPVFQRMWNLYLAYSEAGFRAGYLDAHQLVLERAW
jgi:Protein of unknown function (DUF1365)/Mycolic acid cyclopropane synthetase